MKYYSDTIAAISTPIGRGGIGIIRISGELIPEIALELLGKVPKPRTAEYLPFRDKQGSTIEKVITLFFPKPHSFTGENILEIHGHGGYIILNILLSRILEISSKIRLANPGEFTERAFLNNKIDLIQAESIADIIDATSYQAAKAAYNSLQGFFSNQIHNILDKIIYCRMHVESTIDFSDQDIDTISYNKIKKILKNIITETDKIYKSAYSGSLLRDGIKIIIAGKPNAGKSSLFNALINLDRAIISSIPGTTRDTLYETIQLNGITFHITDTAGLQEHSTNEIELIGIKRAKNELKLADHILWVVDSSSCSNKYDDMLLPLQKTLPNINKKTTITIIRNKSDLSLEKNGIYIINGYTCITLSALLNSGIDLLKKYLYNNTKHKIQHYTLPHSIEENQNNFIARQRHLNIIKNAYQYLLSAQKQLNHYYCGVTIINDRFAEDLRYAHDELNKIFGKSTPDNLLKKIFSSFCIGK
ncbi:tRNA modification GTPase [Candidatus Blochmanniella vafra str. BVAF]|uniref:tRNA modification GTPase MnmE n=1 Tax=Blochmanniella vafra (strain BVAF) TaxID=859654 RepID=E8Q5V6_BLOVB|nr:tRNA uridine-5-carboxymethylaminomethyl(34) synthesis GTPase MnmE [Candidatus Blochmannia vafer]ADV33425.1 tRNA modification GTPase [Candidatus Blochmannia vafer str. BVAF]